MPEPARPSRRPSVINRSMALCMTLRPTPYSSESRARDGRRSPMCHSPARIRARRTSATARYGASRGMHDPPLSALRQPAVPRGRWQATAPEESCWSRNTLGAQAPVEVRGIVSTRFANIGAARTNQKASAGRTTATWSSARARGSADGSCSSGTTSACTWPHPCGSSSRPTPTGSPRSNTGLHPRPQSARGHLVAGRRDIGNLAAAHPGRITRAVTRKPEMIRYRPRLIDGCPASTGMTLG